MNGPIATNVTLGGSTAIAVGKSAIVYTDSIALENIDTFALSFSCATVGTPDIKIEIQQSTEPPATEGSADGNFVTPSGVNVLVGNLTTKTVYHYGLQLVPVKYLRFKLTEQTGTVTDTVMTMKFSKQARFAY